MDLQGPRTKDIAQGDEETFSTGDMGCDRGGRRGASGEGEDLLPRAQAGLFMSDRSSGDFWKGYSAQPSQILDRLKAALLYGATM